MQSLPNAFAASPLDRAAHRRKDPAWLAEAHADARAQLIPFWRMQPFLLSDSGASPVAAAGWLDARAGQALAGPESVWLFLGVDPQGAPHFALDLSPTADPESLPIAGLGTFEDMRAAAARLPGPDTAILGCAKALYEWHARHRFCANCGAATAVAEAGWKRQCEACAAEHFPRLDPVTIMLAVRGDRCCLGRQPRFPKGMYSALAGFVEPGESLEEACARELMEEAGLKALSVRYVSSQPWPFPASLMIGLIAEVADEALTLDHDEIEDAVWLSRQEAQAALAGGADTERGRIWAPPPLAIAHQLIRHWAFG